MKYRIFIFPLIFLMLCSCADLFQEKVNMINSSNGTLSTLLSEEETISKLQTSNQFFVSQYVSPTDILLNWQDVLGASSYVIERAIVSPEPDGSFVVPEEFDVLEQFVYGNSYVDKILTEADSSRLEYKNRYYYRIIAENYRLSYESSDPSKVLYGTLFASPGKVTASLGKSTDSIIINWDKVSGASSYEIYRADNSACNGISKIASVSADRLSYKNSVSIAEQGKEYYYRIFARNDYNNNSAPSAIAMGYALKAGAPSQPQNVKITNGRGNSLSSIKLSWDEVSAESEVSYDIYRTSTLDAGALTSISTGYSGTTYEDKNNLKQGLFYYYQVLAKCTDNETQELLKGQMSDSGIGSENPAEAFILSSPQNIKAEKTNDAGQENYYLYWIPAIGNESEQASYTYSIYGSGDDVTYHLLEEVAAKEVQADGYIKHKVETQSDFYKIATKNVTAGIESVMSSAIAPSPFAAKNVSVTKYANLSGEITSWESSANAQGVYPVKITWEKPDNDKPAAYYVYRSTKPDSGFVNITKDNPITGNFVYYDKNDSAKTGTQYYYKVLSLNSLMQGSNFSETAVGYGALTAEQYMREYNKTVMASQKKLTLMHKSSDTDKLGSESIVGTISGSLAYNAAIAGLGARITMHYDNYADFYISGSSSLGVYFNITGDTNTSAQMDASGTMDGTVTCTGMYPGTVYYDKILIKAGAAGGGTYGIKQAGFEQSEVSYLVGNE